MPRRSAVRTAGVERTCVDCHRTGLDVRVDHDQQPRCFPGIGCQGKAELARRLPGGAA